MNGEEVDQARIEVEVKMSRAGSGASRSRPQLVRL